MVIETPPGSNLAYTRLKAEEVARAGAGEARGGLHVHDDRRERRPWRTVGAVDEATVYVRLMPKAERSRHQEDVAQELRREFKRHRRRDRVDQRRQLRQPEADPGAAARARRWTELNRLAPQIAGPAAEDARCGRRRAVHQGPEAGARGRSWIGRWPGRVGVTVGQVAQALRPAFAGIDAGDWVDPLGKTRDVTVRLVPEARTNVADLESLPLVIHGPDGPVTRAARPGGARHGRAWARRGSITSTASG